MTFIKLTEKDVPKERAKVRLNPNNIAIYGEYHKGGSYIMMDGFWDNRWLVEETPYQIDQLIKEINNGGDIS